MEWRKLQRLEQLGTVLHAKYRVIYGLTVCIFLSFIAFYFLVPISYARTDIYIPKSLFAWFSSSLSSTSPVYDNNTGGMISWEMIGGGESVMWGKDGEFLDKDGIFENAAEENLTLGVNGRGSEEKDSILDGTHEKNLTLEVNGGSSEEKKSILNGTHNKNLTFLANDGRSEGKGTNLNRTDDDKNPTFGLLNNGSSEAKRLESVAVYNKLNETERNVVGNVGECDIFNGKWVRDDKRKLYYNGRSCPYIDTSFNCHKNGRPDYEFLKWRWQPNGCNIPSLNATDFLERLRGRRLVFVGDSLNRNMWESLVCILRQSVTNKKRVYEISGRRNFKGKGYYGFVFKDYNCSVDFARSTFLVRETYHKGAHGIIDEKLRLDLMDETASAYRKADIIVFNTGHWWTHEKTSRGVNYYQEGNHVHPVLKVTEAYEKALTTWAKWVDKNINSKKTRVFFRGYALTHFKGGQWNSGGRCHKETEPISNETFLVKYPSKMRTLEQVLKRMKTQVMYMNISRLTDYRKDGHPSIYRMKYNTLQEQISAEMSQDCSHWCLPGVPDTWNELLYASLLRDDR